MWYIDENLGLYNDEFMPMPQYAIICPVSPAIWHIDPFSNSGFPICDLMIGIPRLRIKVVDQDPYVSVFDVSTKNKEDFNGNGHVILRPTECIVHQVLNGEYSVRLTHPMDDDGKWTYIRERNYLKVLGQIFTIISVDSDTSVSLVGEELYINQFSTTVDYYVWIPYVFKPTDYDGFLSSDGKLLCSKKNYDLRLLPYGTKIVYYSGENIAGVFYAKTVERVQRAWYKISAVSAIGLLDKQYQ